MAIAADLDTKCIDTIRTLCIDAIEAADSGHPGTPIGIAPVTYTLWQRFLRFDPADPIWPNRDRYVLSSGHASSLLWSMLHLTRRTGRRPRLRDPRRGRRSRSTTSATSASSTRSAPGTRSTAGRAASRRRPDRSGPGPRRRSAWRSRASGSARATTATATPLRLRRLRAARRRLHDGGHHLGGGLVRGASAPLEPVLDLRLEPGHDRGPHRHHVHRGRRRAIPRVRLERRRPSRTRTTSSRPRKRSTPSRPSTNARR